MKQYAGIDVSLEASYVCVGDAEGKIVREAKVLSELMPYPSGPATVSRDNAGGSTRLS